MNTESGEKVLSAVEYMLRSNDAIHAEVEAARRDAGGHRDGACRRLVRIHAQRSALAGALAAAPASLPGVGTAVTLGATVVEMAYLLKAESELCLALCAAYDFDIRSPAHRQIAFMMAAIGTHEVLVDRSPLLDAGEITMEAVLTYAPRELGKQLLKLLTILAAAYAGGTVAARTGRLLPVIGVGIGAGVNGLMTARIGHAARRALSARLAAVSPQAAVARA